MTNELQDAVNDGQTVGVHCLLLFGACRWTPKPNHGIIIKGADKLVNICRTRVRFGLGLLGSATPRLVLERQRAVVGLRPPVRGYFVAIGATMPRVNIIVGTGPCPTPNTYVSD